jgi:hypothetical protein
VFFEAKRRGKMDSLFQVGTFLWEATYRQVIVNAAFHAAWGVAFLLGSFVGIKAAMRIWPPRGADYESADYGISALAFMFSCFFLLGGIFSIQEAIRGFVATDYQTVRELLGLAKGVIK